MEAPSRRATEFLNLHLGGDPGAEAELMPLIYEELHRLAAHHLREEKVNHTLAATALVHEAWLRLIECDRMVWNGKTHFFAMAATMLRRVLVDHARARKAQKRGGEAERVTLSALDAAPSADPLDLLALDEAIAKLAAANPRQARVVELRFFADLSVDETAEVLGVSSETIKTDWRFARAFLNRELTRGGARD